MTLAHPCCWMPCDYWATCQTTAAAPPELGSLAVVWFCALHLRQWERARGSGLLWVNHKFGRAPLVGFGILVP